LDIWHTILAINLSLNGFEFVAGVAGLTLPLARELAPFGVRVMSIAPGMFDTPMTRVDGADFEDIGKKLQEFPQRKGRPSEFAGLVTQILQNSMLNGSVIRLDGAVRIGKPGA
jgi:NAD(P)-dependent dehydrogenase (short-subunit alcohol dehydrogenase family)